MKKTKHLLLMLLLIVLGGILVGCDFTTYKVDFNTNGGSTIASKSTTGVVARPSEPTKSGYTFAGWYTDPDCNNPFDFSQKISSNIILYAKWKEGSSTDLETDPINNNPKEYIVTFNTNGGSTINSVSVTSKISKPTDPTRNGYNFIGWFIDDSCTNEFDFNQDITSDITLYAGWEEIKYTVTFNTDGGSQIAPVTVTSTLNKPADPTKDGYNFVGWYTDTLKTQAFDFNTRVTSNLTLYAKWSLITNTNYYRGTINTDQVDAYILAMSFNDNNISTSSQYALFLDYAVLNRLESFDVKLDKELNNEEFSAFTDEGLSQMKISLNASFNFSLLGRDLTTSISYDAWGVYSASNTDVYTQVPFVCSHKQSSRTSSFIDFPINQNQNTYAVTDTEQLCYVVEHGYRPTFSSSSCKAKQIYNMACDVLRNICDDNMNDIEKLHAIYDWIIENVTYDGTLYDRVLGNSSNLKIYKGFFLEGVFEDHRAVCDGISKAFMLLARIEGIECVQVSGVSRSSGVGHAWNKVRIDSRWYIVDATGGGVIVGSSDEMMSHRLLMCNDTFYNHSYYTTEYTNFIADSEYSIYRDMTYTY